MTETTIQLQGVTRRYGPVLGLNDVTLKIGPGITGLIGPNGAGKTTFINLVVGLHRANSGTVQVFGQDPHTTTAVRGRIGYCPDGERVWEWQSGREFVATLGRFSGLTDREADTRAAELLTELELAEAMDKPVAQYSRGMRQKTKLAQALLHRPDLLVLDEPLNGVDPLSRHQILKRLERWAADGGTVVVSSHVLPELAGFVDRVVLLQRGRLLASGGIEEIRDLLDEHPHTIRLEGQRLRTLGPALLAVDGVVSVSFPDGPERVVDVKTRNPGALYARLPELATTENVVVEQMWSPDSSLEAVFRYLVKGGGR